MLKQMEAVTVSTKDGQIWIEQQDQVEESHSHIVMIHPDQLPTFIQWLQEAAAELRGE